MTTEDIAARSGASKATIYNWWPTKYAVAVEAFQSQMAVESADPDTGSAREDFRLSLPLNLSCAPPQPGSRGGAYCVDPGRISTGRRHDPVRQSACKAMLRNDNSLAGQPLNGVLDIAVSMIPSDREPTCQPRRVRSN
jgi:AcrR family transcriptional regulator